MAHGGATSDVQARIVAGRLLSIAAGRGSAALDHFSGWLLSGFGAAFALLFTNIDAVSKHVSIASLRMGLMLFLWGLAVGVVAKLLAAMVSAGAEAAELSAAIGRDLANEHIEVDFNRMFAETERAYYWPMRLMVASSFRKVSSGDFAAGGRLHAKVAQVQSIFVLGEVVFLAASAATVGSGLAV